MHAEDSFDTCEVCIVGGGITGLNALFVASRYLGRGQKVVLIERRDRIGGMWTDAYPYVRLHQPHPMFTAGNIGWSLDRPPSYLATKGEVLEHFQHCRDEIAKRVTVDERCGWEFVSEEQVGGRVRVTCRKPDGRLQVVDAKRLIKAYGFGVNANEPLALSSRRVRSVSPDSCDVRRGELHDSTAPVWVIGGGKTAMDTAHAIITTCPGREVNLLAGSGTFFSSRDSFFPAGGRRWWGGTQLNALVADIARRYDGTNEIEVARWYRSRHGVWLTPTTGNFLLGMLSEQENRTISTGLSEVVMDHLVDVVDRGDSTEMALRSGRTTPIEPGSWVVNCTGYIGRTDQPYEPYTNADGSVLSIQTRSATLHLTSFMGYFMTHLMFLGKLREMPLYELDTLALYRQSKPAWPFAAIVLAQHNLGLIADEVPNAVFNECGLDYGRWYPWPHRMASAMQFMLTHRRDRPKLQKTLDTIRDRFDVRCGPLDSLDLPGNSGVDILMSW